MAHLGTIGTKTQSSASSGVAITLTAAAAVGSTVLVSVIWEAGGGTGVPTISAVTDFRSNTYSTTPDVTAGGASNSTVAGAVLRTRVTTALQVGDTITVTISGGTRSRWAMQADAWDDVDASPLDKTATTGNTAPSSASLSTGTTAATAQAHELVYAIFGFGSGRTVTIPGGWTGGAKVETSAGSTDRALQVAWKYVNTTATQEGTLTLSSSSTYAAAAATFKYTPTDPPVAQVSQLKLEVPLPSDAPVAHVSQLKLEVPQAVTGVVQVSQLRLTVPAAAGMPPYSGIKAKVDGKLWNASIWAADPGA